MAIVSPFVRQFVKTASYIAIVQGIVWTIFALLVILLYSEAWVPKYDAITYGQTLSSVIVALYAYDNSRDPVLSNLSISPTVLLVFAIVYGFASLAWLAISNNLLRELQHENREVLRKRCQQWSNWTLLICVMDFVLACILASDYNYTVGQLNLNATTVFLGLGTYIVLAIGILMTLAARGFVLLIVNLMLALVIRKLPIDFSQVMPQVQPTTGGLVFISSVR